ncbi:hypothetical protein [Thalassoglobus polymorphus]|uniref:Uncharacterized protein n=1 Tax=Thalassoglobus polymorphus TaxID=2527994 RepID=A0A517QHX2_9PLAN|nr:hypothetical protein [Thalassoglobus polymorphus]QDT31231.1 hypothetical protein Mal48_04630 [Thalassoglobus polymorphus]
MQHAQDFANGLRAKDVIAAMQKEGFDITTRRGFKKANYWWHRRVFTRAIKNIHDKSPGFKNLEEYVDDIYNAYKRAGGDLSLDEIYNGKFEGFF